MTRLQKKCLIAAAGTHLLVVVAILCSGFIRPAPRPDNSTVLDVIPANIVDGVLNSGVKSAPMPPARPMPVVTPPQPAPPVPQPPTPPTPAPQTFMQKVEKMLEPERPPVEDTQPSDQPQPKKQTHQIDVDLTPVVHTVSKSSDTSAKDAREQKRLLEKRREAIAEAARAIQDNASSATTVEMPGTSSVSYANYASVIKSIYDQTWIAPDNSANDNDDVHVKVTIASDGHVITSSILTPSGDPSMDDSVQRTLDRVTFIAPFPDGATEKERSFTIDFNLKAKRMLE